MPACAPRPSSSAMGGTHRRAVCQDVERAIAVFLEPEKGIAVGIAKAVQRRHTQVAPAGVAARHGAATDPRARGLAAEVHEARHPRPQGVERRVVRADGCRGGGHIPRVQVWPESSSARIWGSAVAVTHCFRVYRRHPVNPNPATPSTTIAASPPAMSLRPGVARRADTAEKRRRPAAGRRQLLQLGEQLVGRGEPVLGALLEAAHDQPRQRGRHIRLQLEQRPRPGGDVRGQDRLGRSTEGQTAGQQLVGEHADGVLVGAVVHGWVGHGLLGRHVGGRAQRHADGGEGGRRRRLR